MGQRRLSIRDIATAAGVSHSTVSRALHDSPLISPDVRARIQSLARELGYTPNAIAQSLQSQRTHTIGLVLTSIADPFFADVARGVEDVARPAGLSVLLGSSHNSPEQEAEVVETFYRRRVDGIILAASRLGSQHMAALARYQLPTVLINSQADEESAWLGAVAVDDYAGACLAVGHLLALGHRRIGYLGTASRPRSNRRRYEGYRDSLDHAGVNHGESWAAIDPGEGATLDDDLVAGQRLFPRLLAAGVTAVFCYNDIIAAGALLACRDMGGAVPRDCSLIGFDDIALARCLTPTLTTIHQPRLELGRLAMQMVRDLLDSRPVQDCLLTPTLQVRGTTAPPHPKDSSL